MTIYQDLERLKQELIGIGITRVVIDYCGSGDDGSVTAISAYRVGDQDSSLDREELDRLIYRDDPTGVAIRVAGKILGEEEEKLSERLSNFVYAALDHASVPDWVNNEGGEGRLTIDLSPEAEQFVKIEHHEGYYEEPEGLTDEQRENGDYDTDHRYKDEAQIYTL